MVEIDKITTEKVKRSGLFDFKEVYQFVHRWLIEENYLVDEEKYVEEAGETKKIEIVWKAKKKISDYFRLDMKLQWRILGMTTVEVEREGKREKMNKGSFEIKITGSLAKDYQGGWEANPMSKFLRGVYDRFIIEGRIDQYEGKMFKDVEDLVEQIKAFLTIEGLK